MGTIFFSIKLLDKLLELFAKLLAKLELLKLLELLELIEEKIHEVLLAKCYSSLDGYRNSLPHFLHICSLLERLPTIFF